MYKVPYPEASDSFCMPFLLLFLQIIQEFRLCFLTECFKFVYYKFSPFLRTRGFVRLLQQGLIIVLAFKRNNYRDEAGVFLCLQYLKKIWANSGLCIYI